MENLELSRIREDLKHALNTNQEISPVMQIFRTVDLALRRITRRSTPYPWYTSVILLALIVPLPTVMVCFLLNESEQWNVLGLIWIGYLEHAVASLVLTRFVLKYLFQSFQDYIVDNIENKEDLERFSRIVSYVWETPHYKQFRLTFTIFWCVAFSIANSIYIGQFIGIGLTIGTIVYGLLISSIMYLVGWLIYINPQFGLYKYHLNNVAPYQSEIVFHLSRIFKSLLYILAIWYFLTTLMVSFNNLALIIVLFVAWIPTAIIFFQNQSSLNKIITTAKWTTLKGLQTKIQEVQINGILDKDTVGKINYLMDLYGRIWATPNSTFDLRTGLSFINQLALPVIGFLIANSSNIRSFFR